MTPMASSLPRGTQGKKLTAAVSRPAAGRRSAPVQAMMGGQEPRERKFITREEVSRLCFV